MDLTRGRNPASSPARRVAQLGQSDSLCRLSACEGLVSSPVLGIHIRYTAWGPRRALSCQGEEVLAPNIESGRYRVKMPGPRRLRRVLLGLLTL